MTKSIEVTIALMILFFFIFSAIQINNKYTTLTISQTSKDYIYLRAEDDNIRDVVNNKDVNLLNNIFYNHLDMEYFIRICDYINTDCLYTDEAYKDYKNTKSINYYFADINKTLTVVFGYS
jgi:hypothetical protein